MRDKGAPDLVLRLTFFSDFFFLPLDMIFISDGLKVLGVLENVEPMTTKLRSVDAPSKFVLEVNGGWSKRHGLKIGLKVKMDLD